MCFEIFLTMPFDVTVAVVVIGLSKVVCGLLEAFVESCNIMCVAEYIYLQKSWHLLW
jgi:hypothetical protein